MSDNACVMEKIGADVVASASMIVRASGGAPKFVRVTAMARRRARILLGEAEMLLWIALCGALKSVVQQRGLPAPGNPGDLEDFTLRLSEDLARLLARAPLTLLMVRVDEVREAE